MKDISTLFFNHHFKIDLDWGQQHKLRLGAVLPSNKKQLSNSLKDLSAESIRNRFMGSKKEFSDNELTYLTTMDGRNHYAIGIEERERPYRGVAVVRLVRSASDQHEAEVAITIIDEYQNMGLGTLLIRLITLAASEREIQRLSFTFLPQNEGIIRLIHKMGIPRPGIAQMDYVQLYVEMKDVDIESIKSQLRPLLPEIDTFGLKT